MIQTSKLHKWFFILLMFSSRGASFGWSRVPLIHKYEEHEEDDSTILHDVTNFGAVGDGKTDDSKAFLNAWTKACASPSPPPTLKVPPEKSFVLNPVTFRGPCKSSSINVQILGNILAPKDISAWKGSDKEHWLIFDSIRNLTINGSGKIDGQGSSWWECRNKHKCSNAPDSILINGCDGFRMNNVKLVNSPKMHMKLTNCTGAYVSGITITAPKDSPNTDGIHLQGCDQIRITNSTIGTGDDCISVGTKTSNVNITQIRCGPGHGISIGSLGRYGESAAVEQIFVSNCNFTDTMNGLRIKTWPGGSGFARNIRFENIIINSTDNPIIIDQYYCNGEHNCPNKTSAVKLSDVSFRDVRGTSSEKTAINLACSKTVACTDIHLENVHLRSLTSVEKVASSCSNVQGAFRNVTPPVTCFTRQEKLSETPSS